MVPSRKPVAYQLSGTKGGIFGPKIVPKPLPEQHSSNSHGQHYSGLLHKQRRGGDEVRPFVCPSVEGTDLVYQKTGHFQSSTHPGPSECGSRQAIQTGPDHTNRVVSPSRDIPGNMQQVAHTKYRPFCHKVQQQAESVCFPSTRSPGLGSGRPQPTMGGSGPLCLSPSCHLGQSSGEIAKQPMPQNHSDCSGVAQHAFWDLVTMSSQIPLSLPHLPNLLTQRFKQTPHRNLSNLNLHAWLLEPQQSSSRVSLRQWQQELRLLKEDPPDQSMRQSGPFLQNGATVIRWTSGHPL